MKYVDIGYEAANRSICRTSGGVDLQLECRSAPATAVAVQYRFRNPEEAS